MKRSEVDKKWEIRKGDRLTRPPRMEGSTRNAKMFAKKLPHKSGR
ncbi:MAG: hypothetical protein UY54_C0004G0019 [Parcubacteria group bacterium GW2011_GWA2_50_10b]|nr:MAG: hypothetical protein UY54_C0004G0019 [Parcubacteria group bacterium GW2011_GWA2_50_10b]